MRTGQGDLQMASQVGRSGRGQPQPSLILSLLKNLAGSPLDEAEADRLALNKQLKIHDLWRAPCRIRSQTKKTLSPAFFSSWRRPRPHGSLLQRNWAHGDDDPRGRERAGVYRVDPRLCAGG